jgi:hypothetical protein
MLGSNVWLQHEHWLQWVTNLKITNNVTCYKFAIYRWYFNYYCEFITYYWHAGSNEKLMNDDLTQTLANNIILHRVHCLFFSNCVQFCNHHHHCRHRSHDFTNFCTVPAKGPHCFHNFMQSPHTQVKLVGGEGLLYSVVWFCAISMTCIMAAVPAH